MKKLLVLAACILMMVSCSSGPDDAAVKFSENLIVKGKIDEAKKYATQSTAQFIDFGSRLSGGLEVKPNAKISAKTDSINGNEAWVTVTTKDGDDESSEQFNMVKVDGEWKVNIQSKK